MKFQKTVSCFVILVLFFAGFIASAQSIFVPPVARIFSQIQHYAARNSFQGYDLVACFDRGNRNLLYGGTHHWSAGYQLFSDKAGERTNLGVFKKVPTGGNIQVYQGQDLKFETAAAGGKGSILYFLAQFTDKRGQRSDFLRCYLWNSGLESVR